MWKRLFLTGLILLVTLSLASGMARQDSQVGEISPAPGKDNLGDGEARIWYLGHAGWAVETQTHFLIFDYAPGIPRPTGTGIEQGDIRMVDWESKQIFVFISHSHGDHYWPGVLNWAATADITYIFGWDAHDKPGCVYLTDDRSQAKIGNLEVWTIHHQFDNIPEAAFLVRVDGVTLYHSGDHGSTGKQINPLFKDNIDYLEGLKIETDIAFLSQFGQRGEGELNVGDRYTINRLRPRATFPMHQGGGEKFYKIFAQEARAENLPTNVYPAEKPGHMFTYRNRKIRQ